MGQEDGKFQSFLVLYHTDSDKMVATTPVDGGVAYALETLQREFCAVTEQGLYLLDSGGELKASYSYGGQFLRRCVVGDGGWAALLLSRYKSGGYASLITVDGDGNELGGCDIDGEVLDISTAGRYVAVLFSDRLTIYDKYLTEVATLPDVSEVRAVLMRADGSAVLAVFAAALLGSAILANALADSVSDWLTPRVEQYVLDRLTNGHGDEAVSAAAASDNEALAGLVDFDAITGIAKKAMDSAVEAGKNMLEGAVTGMIRSLAYGLLFLVSFLVLTLLLRLLTSPLQLAARAPVLGAVNRLAGAALGLCLGVLAMFAAASVLQWTGLVDAATLRDTYLLKYFTQHSPMDIIAMLG